MSNITNLKFKPKFEKKMNFFKIQSGDLLALTQPRTGPVNARVSPAAWRFRQLLHSTCLAGSASDLTLAVLATVLR